jgi:hypothetical protein
MISARNGTDQYSFKNIVHDGSKPNVFQDTTKNKIAVSSIDYQNDLPAPEYQNSGFYESGNKIKQWSQYYGKYFPASKSGKMQIPTDWLAGDIAIETEGAYGFYICMTAHTSSHIRPGDSPYFKKITWDENGIRSDQPEWNSKTVQSNFPPDDLRLRYGSYWQKLGLGFPGK